MFYKYADFFLSPKSARREDLLYFWNLLKHGSSKIYINQGNMKSINFNFYTCAAKSPANWRICQTKVLGRYHYFKVHPSYELIT